MADINIIRWWQWIPIFRWRIVGTVESADEVPARLPRNGAILVGSLAAPKWIAFDCPCRTGHRILLNADRARRPHWSVGVQRRLTITPSVDFKDASKRCHYIVRNGHIQWV
jgi:hypothetical protein